MRSHKCVSLPLEENTRKNAVHISHKYAVSWSHELHLFFKLTPSSIVIPKRVVLLFGGPLRSLWPELTWQILFKLKVWIDIGVF